MVDDSPSDVDLTMDVLTRSEGLRFQTVPDGVEAVAFLRGQGKYAGAQVPDLIVLDLNLPKKDGRAVLAEIKADAVLRTIPVVVFSTSQARHDIAVSHELGANSYVSKPGNLREFVAVVESIGTFWFRCARLPHKGERC